MLYPSKFCFGYTLLLLDVPKELFGCDFRSKLLKVLVLVVVGVGNGPFICHLFAPFPLSMIKNTISTRRVNLFL